jgi:phosphate/sulfate permease
MQNAGLIWFFYVITPLLGLILAFFFSSRMKKREGESE